MFHVPFSLMHHKHLRLWEAPAIYCVKGGANIHQALYHLDLDLDLRLTFAKVLFQTSWGLDETAITEMKFIIKHN
jgi:hypothetical protein